MAQLCSFISSRSSALSPAISRLGIWPGGSAVVPIANPPAFELARQNWEHAPQSPATCDAYLAELLKTFTNGTVMLVHQQQIVRLIASHFEAGNLAWWVRSCPDRQSAGL